MGIISALADGALVEIPTQWAQLLPAIDELGVPALEAEVAYMDQDELTGILQKCPNRQTVAADRKKYRRLFGSSAVRGFREQVKTEGERHAFTLVERPGICRDNLRRVSAYYATHPTQLQQLPEQVLPDADDIPALTAEFDALAWSTIEYTALALDGFARAQIEREKKDSARSSATTIPGLPPSSASVS